MIRQCDKGYNRSHVTYVRRRERHRRSVRGQGSILIPLKRYPRHSNENAVSFPMQRTGAYF